MLLLFSKSIDECYWWVLFSKYIDELLMSKSIDELLMNKLLIVSFFLQASISKSIDPTSVFKM